MPGLSSRPPYGPVRPPSAQSPFAQLGCYLRWGDVIRLLGGHYPSVVAHTGSFAAPIGLSPPSAFSLVWRVLADCNQSLLPMAASRRYLRQSVLGCWIPYPGGTTVCSRLFLPRCHRPSPTECGSASRVYPANDFSQGNFRGRRYSVMFRPPSLLAPQIVSTAARTAAGQPGLLHPGNIVLRYLRTHRIC